MTQHGDAATVARSVLRIDEEQAVAKANQYLLELIRQTGAKGALLGLSGGIDSALLAALAVRSLGSDVVYPIYLSDRDSRRAISRNAGLIAEWLGIKLERINIEEPVRERGAYDSALSRLTRFSPLVSWFLHTAYQVVAGETPFVSSLRVGAGENDEQGRGAEIRKAVGVYSGESFIIRHRYRREYLEMVAAERGWMVLGAANRSEWKIGWFVHGGVDGLPIRFQPIIGLYKTQVRQLASYLDIPEDVCSQAPSPDMMRGITDEYGLGLSYAKIDLVLDRLEGGLSEENLLAAGVTQSEIDLVQTMNRLSAWKRSGEETTAFAVDGGPMGGLRRG